MKPKATKAFFLLAVLLVAAQAFAGTIVSYTQVVNKATPGIGGVPAVTLARSPDPSTFNQSVTFTATVPAQATGTVTFLDGSTSIGTGTVSSGTATLSISTLSGGIHTVTASYGGDSNFNPATSSAINQTVNKAASSITLASATNPSTFGGSVVLTAAITGAPGGPNYGTVTFYDGTTSLGTATPTAGVATLSLSTLTAGTHSLTAAYAGDRDLIASASPVLSQVVNKAAGTISIVSSSNPANFETPVTFTATVNPAATGTVSFYDGTTKIGSGVIAAGSANMAISTLSGGTHSVTAQYGGDGNFLAGTSAPLTETITLTPTTTALTSSANPSIYDSSITLKATIGSSAPSGPNYGTVTFYDGPTSLGTATPTAGVATLTLSTLTAGTHSLTAAYAGDRDLLASTSPVLSQVVSKATGAISVTSATNPSTFGQTIVFTAHVPSDASGSVTFLDGSTSIGTGTVSSGTATLSISTLTAGTHSVSISYSGDSNYSSGTSSAISQVVNKATLSATVSGVPNPSTYLQTVTISFQSTAVAGVMPTGTVQFADGSTPIGTPISIDATGKATITVTTLAAGSHTINATYSGDGNFQ